MFIYHYLFTLVLKSPDGEWPITYIIIIIIEDRDICKIAKSGKLKILKVVELKNIRAKFALSTVGNKQRKMPYVDAIEELVKSCSCSK